MTSEIENIRQFLEEVVDLKDNDAKLRHFAMIESELRRAQGTKRSLKMETRLVADVGQRRQYENRLSRLEEELSHLASDVQALKQSMQHKSLMEGANGSMAADDLDTEDYQKAGDDMLNKASAIQDKTQESLNYTKNLVAESKEVGTSTLTELERQREVLNRIDFEADRINDNLNRAELLVKQFGKRMASDKFIQCFAVINVLMLVGVILYAVFGKGTSLGTTTGEPPPNPTANNRMLLHLRGHYYDHAITPPNEQQQQLLLLQDEQQQQQ